MPAGVAWGTYLRFCAASMLAMFAGSQTMHMLYRPLEEMDQLVEDEIKKLQKELVEAIERGDVKIRGQATSSLTGPQPTK